MEMDVIIVSKTGAQDVNQDIFYKKENVNYVVAQFKTALLVIIVNLAQVAVKVGIFLELVLVSDLLLTLNFLIQSKSIF